MGELTDEEYYKSFRVSKHQIEDTVDLIAAAVNLAVNERIMPYVKQEIGAHPDVDVMLRYFQDLMVESVKKVGNKTLEQAIEAAEFAIMMKKQQMSAGWKVDKDK